ncbi:MAG: zinc ribbon domain-containing protein [Ruminococcus sp.]|nr:zinc ribbon domain-containing protein [Ruminococcus sp.]
MTSVLIIKITLGVIGAVVGVFAAVKIGRGVKKTSELIDKVIKATDDAATKPLSISGAEGLMRQRVKRDFPGFDADYAGQIVRSAIATYFAVLNEGTGADRLRQYCTDALVLEVEAMLDTNTINYEGVKIHSVAMSDYRKHDTEAVITYQAALEYKPPKKMLQQHIYSAKYVYYLTDEGDGELASLRCPYCGAPIRAIGKNKFCEYCGGGLANQEISVERTWKVNKILKLR